MAELILPQKQDDKDRWQATSLRHRIITGEHIQDVRAHQAHYLDPRRQDAWGPPDLSLNLYLSYISQLATLYEVHPIYSNDGLSPEASDYLTGLNVFGAAEAFAQRVLGLSECLYRIHWASGSHVSEPRTYLRIVTPDRVTVTDSPDAPGKPIIIEERVTLENGEQAWEVYDISDPANPSFRILGPANSEGDRKDLTLQIMGELPRWEWNGPKGPYLPWVLYHARSITKLWNPTIWSEVVCATLQICTLWSFFGHSVRNASWRQKYGIDVELAGTAQTGKGKNSRSSVSTDPASILLFRTDGGGGSVSTLQDSIDPRAIAEAIVMYTSAVLESMGLTSADVESISPESGVAIQIRKDALRKLQRGYVPTFRVGDLELIQKISMISNTFGVGVDAVPVMPVDGWTIQYPGLPETREESHDRFDGQVKKMGLGLVSIVDIFHESHPEMTRIEAAQALVEIQRENRFYANLMTANAQAASPPEEASPPAAEEAAEDTTDDTDTDTTTTPDE